MILLDFFDIIKGRRSVRQYSNKPIDKEILRELVDTARLAPSANNIQSWEFVVVTERKMLREISEKATWGKFIKDAAAAIIVSGKRDNSYIVEDCSAATENILLAAKAFGIGSCWVAGYKKEYSEEIGKMLELPKGIVIVSIISLGYPLGENVIHDKRALKDLLHWEKY
ncbi:MAG: nitroreductase family protein [Candidatus Woesearchaeota archaeon]|nr:nitroreductase family protein [Candidatus Woesearchaeota archaeon]